MHNRVVLCGFANGDFPYINFTRYNSGPTGTDYAYPAILGDNGYPSGAPTGHTLGSRVFTNLSNFDGAYIGAWVVKWKGKGRFNLAVSPGTFSVVRATAGSVVANTGAVIALGGADGRVVLQVSAGITSLDLHFPANTGTFSNFRELVLCRLDQEELHDAGEIFNPDFIAKLRAVNPGVLRFLGWAGTNDGNLISKHNYRAPADYLPMGGWIPNAWVGTITGPGSYTAASYADMPAQWTDGEMFQGLVVDGSTGSDTIDVGGRGAKPLCDVFGGALRSGTMRASSLRTFVYYAALDCVLQKAGGAYREHPIEVQIALCNKIGCDFWYPMNHTMQDESVTALTTLVRDTLNPGLRFFLELSNEVWNSGAGWPQTSVFRLTGQRLGAAANGLTDMYMAYAKRTREVMYLATQAWAPRSSSQLRRVSATQGAGNANLTKTDRLEGRNLGSSGTPGNIGAGTYGCPADSDFGTAPNRPCDYVDVISYATYLSGVNAKNFDVNWTPERFNAVAAQADAYASGDPARVEEALDWLDSDLRGPAGESLAAVVGYTAAHNPVAAKLGKTICCYEGGLEIAPPSKSKIASLGVDTTYHARIKSFFDGYKRDFRCYKLIRQYFDQFAAYSNTEAPAWFWLAQEGQWAMITPNLYGEPFVTFDAVRHHNNGIRRLKLA